MKNKKKIPIFGSPKTIKGLKAAYKYCFYPMFGYKPILKENIIKNDFQVKIKNTRAKFKSFEVHHGKIKATAYVFNKIAYISDCNFIESKNLKYLKNLNYLILDCLRVAKHPSHFNYDEAIEFAMKIKPKKQY